MRDFNFEHRVATSHVGTACPVRDGQLKKTQSFHFAKLKMCPYKYQSRHWPSKKLTRIFTACASLRRSFDSPINQGLRLAIPTIFSPELGSKLSWAKTKYFCTGRVNSCILGQFNSPCGFARRVRGPARGPCFLSLLSCHAYPCLCRWFQPLLWFPKRNTLQMA